MGCRHTHTQTHTHTHTQTLTHTYTYRHTARIQLLTMSQIHSFIKLSGYKKNEEDYRRAYLSVFYRMSARVVWPVCGLKRLFEKKPLKLIRQTANLYQYGSIYLSVCLSFCPSVRLSSIFFDYLQSDYLLSSSTIRLLLRLSYSAIFYLLQAAGQIYTKFSGNFH